MKRIIVADARDGFLSDINMRIVLDDERDIEIVTTLTSTEHLHIAVQRFHPDVIAVCENLLDTQEDWNFDSVQVIGYALSPEGKAAILKQGLPCYGVVRQVSWLLEQMERGRPEMPALDIPAETFPKPTVEERSSKASDIPPVAQEEKTEEQNEQKPVLSSRQSSEPSHSIRSKLSLYKDNERSKRLAEKLVGRDIYGGEKKPKIVTLYSAKGGVGKTTLTTEIGVYLALTSHGRGHYRVCIVDYNIDFGDVLTTLDFSPDGPTMTYWAADIRERIEGGEAPEDICYRRTEIEEYLQVMDKTGLYALLAPLTHEDSMDIGEAELQVMLRNLRDYGGFDFILCDTGNNTRDATIIALEAAEYVLMVITQDITAANCNDSFLATMKKIRFNSDKIRLIINNVLPPKITGVSVQEIEDLFPHECIARIRHDTDVIRANNYSQPIVYQTNHEVTKEIRKIVAFLTDTQNPEQVRKKGKFGLFKQKKG